MDAPTTPRLAPRKILLATDLSARCDRALDRAVLLARRWSASLVAVHAIELDDADVLGVDRLPSWRRGPDQAQIVEAQLRRDMHDAPAGFQVVVEHGEPAALVREVAAREGCDLIVTGVARDETLGRYFLGSTVEKLARRTPAPLLVAKTRARRDYRRIVAATDFSAASRRALETVADFFPEAEITLLHAFEIPFTAFRKGGRLEEAFRDAEREAVRELLEASTLSAAQKARVGVLIEHGSPARIIAAYAADKDVDLVAIGSQGRNAVAEALLGSAARRIIEASPADVLVTP